MAGPFLYSGGADAQGPLTTEAVGKEMIVANLVTDGRLQQSKEFDDDNPRAIKLLAFVRARSFHTASTLSGHSFPATAAVISVPDRTFSILFRLMPCSQKPGNALHSPSAESSPTVMMGFKRPDKDP